MEGALLDGLVHLLPDGRVLLLQAVDQVLELVVLPPGAVQLALLPEGGGRGGRGGGGLGRGRDTGRRGPEPGGEGSGQSEQLKTRSNKLLLYYRQ